MEHWINILKDLLLVPSVTGSEAEVALVLEEALRTYFPDATIERIPVEEGRWNVRMIRGCPRITMTSHFDTVPGQVPVSISPDRISGRGACDAKGQIVAQLSALELAIKRGLRDYCCHYVVGEETQSAGARALVANNPCTTYLLNGEPTGNRFVTRSWGVVDITLTSHGVAAHSSLGADKSAIHDLVTDLHAILGIKSNDISINVGKIQGGTVSNVQADNAQAELCVRYREDYNRVIDLIRAHSTRSLVTVPFPPLEPVPLFVPKSGSSDAIEVQFGSDCSTFTGHFEHVMLFGPGSIAQAHTDHEYLMLTELRTASEHIAELLLHLSRE